MIKTLTIALLGISCLASIHAKQPNVLLICVDDLRPELKSFGADYIHSPNIDRLANEGRAFNRHYTNAPTCGASRYTLLTGIFGTSNNQALFKRAKELEKPAHRIPPSMPEWFRQHGYTTVSVGKVSHHPGGLGGPNWDDPQQVEMPGAWDRSLMPSDQWQHPRGSMHGLANGKIRGNAKEHALIEAYDGDDECYPDGPIANEALAQLKQLAADDKPFFLAVGLIRPHLPFGSPKKYLDLYEGVELPPIAHPQKPTHKTTWHGSGEFMKYQRGGRDPRTDADFADEVRRHYAACVSYADAQVGKLLTELKQNGLDQNTIILLWGDHGWHLGEHAIWGKHALFEESLHAPLIIHTPDMPLPGEQSPAVVETVDIFPTLCDLTGLNQPDIPLSGTSLMPQILNPNVEGHTAIGYNNRGQTIRTDSYRLILHKDGTIELYDHQVSDAETKNVGTSQPEIANQLKLQLKKRLQ